MKCSRSRRGLANENDWINRRKALAARLRATLSSTSACHRRLHSLMHIDASEPGVRWLSLRKRMWPKNFNYAKILLGLREGCVTDWLSHCKNLGYTPPFSNVSYARHLIDELTTLNNLGVVEFELPDDYGGLPYLRDGGNFKIKLNHVATTWLGLLNVSLSDLAKVDLERLMICTPNFPEPKNSKSELCVDVFALMPFGGDFDEIYTNHIKPICRKIKVTCLRGDELSGSDIIVSEIYQLIKNAGLIIADCTGVIQTFFTS